MVTICMLVMLSIVTGCASLNKVQQSLDETNQALLNSTVAF